MSEFARCHRGAVLQDATQDHAAAHSGPEVNIDHVARSAPRAMRELAEGCRACVVLKHRWQTKAVLKDAGDGKAFEARGAVRAHRETTPSIHRAAERDANTIDRTTLRSRRREHLLDEQRDRLHDARRRRATIDGMCAVYDVAVAARQHDALTSPRDLDADRKRGLFRSGRRVGRRHVVCALLLGATGIIQRCPMNKKIVAYFTILVNLG